jgi:hypothetical protein
VAIGNGLDVYAGHSHVPLWASGAVTVDVTWLAVELLVIAVAAAVGWHYGTPAGRRRKSARSPA